ncbi:hypothetical protein Q5752_000707 [Cryptotrichosporon argae]
MGSPAPSDGSTSTPSSATLTRRPPPLPAVKGTMGGIDSPRRALFSPATTATTTLGEDTPRGSPTPRPEVQQQDQQPPRPFVVFTGDPTVKTTLRALDERVAELFGV